MKRTTKYLTAALMSLSLGLGADESAVDEVSLTVYNGGYGVVRETRTLEVEEGQQWVQIRGVPSTIERTSVNLATPEQPGVLKVLEQNYLYDLVNRHGLLDRYVDKDIFLENDGERRKVTLLSQGDGLIVRDGGEIHLSPKGNLVLPELPGGLLTRPTLKWKLQSKLSGNVPTRIRYLAGGLSWSADYNLVMTKDGKTMDLSSWISLTNNSGALFENAKIKLMAGDINRVKHLTHLRREMDGMSAEFGAAGAGVTEKAFAEYHLYELPGRTTLVNRQLKQVEFINETGCKSEKRYRYRQGADKVQALLAFKNDEISGLGLPLPAGKIRMFQLDEDDGQLEFVGEDRIDHTPKKEEIELTLGNSFDLVGESKRTRHVQQRNARNSESTWEITLKNRKEDGPVTIDVRIPVYNNWKILEKNFEYEKVHAGEIKVSVTLEADTEKTLTYSVFNSW